MIFIEHGNRGKNGTREGRKASVLEHQTLRSRFIFFKRKRSDWNELEWVKSESRGLTP